MPRYFRSENASRPIEAGGKTFPLQVIEVVAGTAIGVAEIADADVELFLSVAARWGAEEITAEAYEAELKKKVPAPVWPLSKQPSLMPHAPPLKGHGAVVFDGAAIPQPSAAVPEAAEVIALGAADSPSAEAPRPIDANKRAGHRAKRGTE